MPLLLYVESPNSSFISAPLPTLMPTRLGFFLEKRMKQCITNVSELKPHVHAVMFDRGNQLTPCRQRNIDEEHG